ASYRYQKEVESEKRTIVGVNKFLSPFPPISGILRVNPEQARGQLARLAETKRSRDISRVKASLAHLKKVAEGSENTMPAILECVEAYASLGEVCDVLRAAFGTQKEYLVV
ncbi:MAG: methylmalonyl-CoA mutase family protein, partial [Chloroflexota bacterium]